MWFNPMMAWILRSPLHGMMSGSVMLVQFTGRKSGKHFETPVNYVRSGNDLLTISSRDRSWWRNLRGGGQATLVLQGKPVTATGQTAETDELVAAWLDEMLAVAPQYGGYLKIGKDEAGHPNPDDVAQAARSRVVVRFTPVESMA